MVNRRTITIACLLCGLLVGCSRGGASKGASPTAGASSPTASPLPTLTPTTAMTLWPGLHVKRVTNVVSDQVEMIFQGGATPDGRFLLVKLANRYDPGHGAPYPEHIALYAAATGALRILASARDAKHGLTGFVADNQWVVWYERGLPELSNDQSWTIFAANIASGAITTIAQSNLGGGLYPQPQINQGHLVWDETTGEVTLDRANFVIRLRDMATGAVQTIATKAGNPVISWPWVGWGQVTTADGKGVEDFHNLQTGEQATIPVMADAVILVGTSLVYQLSGTAYDSTNFIYVPDIRNPQDQTQQYAPSNFTSNSFTFNGRYVGWHSGGSRAQPMVYDVQRQQAITLPVQYRPNGSEYTFVAGPYIVWEEDPNTDAQETYSYQTLHQEPPIIHGILDFRTVG